MTTLEKVRTVILKLKKKGITVDNLKPETRLVEDLGLDSLDLMELLVHAEEMFSIKINPDDMSTMKTIGAAVKYFDRCSAKKA